MAVHTLHSKRRDWETGFQPEVCPQKSPEQHPVVHVYCKNISQCWELQGPRQCRRLRAGEGAGGGRRAEGRRRDCEKPAVTGRAISRRRGSDPPWRPRRGTARDSESGCQTRGARRRSALSQARPARCGWRCMCSPRHVRRRGLLPLPSHAARVMSLRTLRIVCDQKTPLVQGRYSATSSHSRMEQWHCSRSSLARRDFKYKL